jgi:hypothetical protein
VRLVAAAAEQDSPRVPGESVGAPGAHHPLRRLSQWRSRRRDLAWGEVDARRLMAYMDELVVDLHRILALDPNRLRGRGSARVGAVWPGSKEPTEQEDACGRGKEREAKPSCHRAEDERVSCQPGGGSS